MSSEAGWRMVKAAEEGNLAQVTEFLRDSVPIDSITKFGISALVGAAGFGRDEVVRALLQCNPPPSIDLLGDDHECALFKACANGHLKVVTLLLAAQPAPRIDLVSRDGTTPMMIACARCYPEIVAELLNVDKGQPNLNARNALQKSAVHLAAFAGEISIVRMLLAAADAYGTPMELDAQDADGMSAVMLAAKSNLRHAKEVLSFLLSSGANPNLQNKKGETALHLASESGNVDAVRALLESPQPANTSLRDNLGQTALVCASQWNRIECVRLLLSAGADVSIVTRGGKTALQLARTEEVENVFLEHEMAKRPASAQGVVGISASELAADESQIGVSESQSGLSVSVSEEAQSNPGPLSTKTANASFFLLSPASEQAAGWKLVKAGEDGDTAAISHMLTHGALVDARNKIGRTALIGAAERGCLASVTTLLDAGATVNLVGDDGECALFKAATNGHTDVVRKLLEAGANVDQANKHNMTPLAAAVANCRPPTVFALLEHHPNIDAPNRSGRTPLIWAGWAGDMSIMSALLAANPPPTLDAVDEDGLTALMHASRSGLRQAPEVAAMLLALPVPARVDLKSRLFQTSLMLSCEAGLLEVSRSLLSAERPADINARDNFGRTALHFAAARGRLDCVRLLLTADPPADLEFEAMMPAMVNGSDVAPRKAEQVAATDEIRVLLTEARRAELLLSLERVAKLNAENKALRKRVSELEARK